jgi:1-acyl-sn-glycerol-3-phosphate acyltransferase
MKSNAWYSFRDPFGKIRIVKRLLISTIGAVTYPGLVLWNRMQIKGTENLDGLPSTNVLFVSNHQTYFADVISILHVICSKKWKLKNSIKLPVYLLNPRINTYFIAADETMRAGIIPKILNYAGGITVKRTWREAGKDINRAVDIKEFSEIAKALSSGWVITFPQGTTTNFAKGRRGTSFIIKKYRPVVIPVVIDGFREAFDKKGLKLRKAGTRLNITFKPPMSYDPEMDADLLLEKIMDSIEQSDNFNKSTTA